MNMSCDVLVVGGGVAGAAAAVAAARGNARTVLVEKAPYWGGTGYAGMFQYICGLYANGPIPPSETLNPGISREFVSLISKGPEEERVEKDRAGLCAALFSGSPPGSSQGALRRSGKVDGAERSIGKPGGNEEWGSRECRSPLARTALLLSLPQR